MIGEGRVSASGQLLGADTSARSTRRRLGATTIVSMLSKLTARPRLGDTAGLVLALAVAIGVIVAEPREQTDWWWVGIALAVAAVGLVAVGSRYLWFVVVVIGALDVVTLAVTASPIALRPVLIVALYRLVRQSDTRSTIWFGGCVAIAVAGLGALFGDGPFWVEWSTDSAMLLLPIAVADARRANLRRRAEAVERRIAEQLQAERLRIAHDLHDIVAHSLSAITVQSGIAAHLFEHDPVVAKQACVEINEVGRRSLDELRSLLGLLRSDDSVPLRPVPADPRGLAEVVAAAGARLPVDVLEEGVYPVGVPESTVVTVHRIVHESLVNVERHAGAVPTTVALVHGDDGVRVVVANAAPVTARAAAPSTGIGLVALRERVEVLGGMVDAAPTDGGGFEVRAFVPYHHHMAGER